MPIFNIHFLIFVLLLFNVNFSVAQNVNSWSDLWNGSTTTKTGFESKDINTLCDFSTGKYAKELSDISSIKNIEVNVNKHRKWVRNGLAILKSKRDHVHRSFFTVNKNNKFEIKSDFNLFDKEDYNYGFVWDSFTDYMNIEQKYKQKFNGKVTVRYDFGSCIYDAKIRQAGDMMDHISYERDSLIQTLSIQLEQGSISNIVNFKLFRKEARNSLSEILITLLLRELGFMTPRTRLVNVIVHGKKRDMLFQENPVKEFLEKNSRREGPLFEGDETLEYNVSSYTDGYPWKWQENIYTLVNTRLENKQWANQGINSLKITLKAHSLLQLVHMHWREQPSDSLSIAQSSINLNFLTQGNSSARKNYYEYDALIRIGLGDVHQFTANRKFYWNSLLNAFEPVYYDSMVVHTEVLSFKPFLFENDTIHYFSKDFIPIVNSLIFKLDNIDEKKLIAYAISLCRGAECKKEDIKKFFHDVRENIKNYRNLLLKNSNQSLFEKKINFDVEQILNNFKNRLFVFLPNSNLYFIDIESIEEQDQGGSTKIQAIKCNISNCIQVKVDKEFIVSMLKSNTYGPNVQHVFGGIYSSNNNKITSTYIDPLNINIKHSLGSKVNYDNSTKTLKFYQQKLDDWFLLSDVEINNLSFEMISNSREMNIKSSQRFNEFGLTGCLNFFQVNFVNTKIHTVGGGCEDSVNIIKSSGKIEKLDVSNAFSDAVDIDFSNIIIKQLNVTHANNDCFDVSGGKYFIEDALLNKCGDKGISVGESSELQGMQIKVNDSNIGISSKDSSITNIQYFLANDINMCLEAYQKKQEFYGSQLFVKNSDCSQFSQGKENNFFKDKNSIISINGIQYF